MLSSDFEGSVAAVSRALAVAFLGGGLVAGLVATNPEPAAFADYGGARLSALLTKDLCSQEGMGGLWRLLIHHCPDLIRSQRPILGSLVRAHSTRRNFGLFSVYRTQLDLAALLPGLRQIPDLRLPRYEATTLAGAGQFLLIESHESVARQP
ncbi:MAG: DUF4359 domain-containing protein [Cyanobacteriota bacterium]|nr:DUF4359 domain-containing protein [Cyanobacteriota bacterium]